MDNNKQYQYVQAAKGAIDLYNEEQYRLAIKYISKVCRLTFDEAIDIVDNIMIKFVTNDKKHAFIPGLTYLATCAYNAMKHQYKYNIMHESLDYITRERESESDDLVATRDILAVSSQFDSDYEAWDTIPKKYHDIIKLKLAGLSMTEIAKLQGVSVMAISKKFKLIKKALNEAGYSIK